jgi:hypothetical protein
MDMSVQDDIHEIDKRMTSHEAVCAERWKEAILRIKRIEGIMLAVAGALIILLLNIAVKLH